MMQRRSITDQEREGGALRLGVTDDAHSTPQLDNTRGRGNFVVGVVCALLTVMCAIGGVVCLFDREFGGAIAALFLAALLGGIAWHWTGLRERIGR